ncbi:hypothetical protein ACODT5_19680 [Streptomyces sp. 5.8]|uniref:hypothetical protein n=1 Tax=Streptomyces sp. 5.8 TaxID=3406571 RepID=UPI003BB80B72
MSGRRRLDWLGLTPEPERELPAAVAALRASSHRPGRTGPSAANGLTGPTHPLDPEPPPKLVASERRRLERLVLRGSRRDWLRYLAEVTALVTAVANGAGQGGRGGSPAAALLAGEVVLDHHRMLIGLPGTGYVRTAVDRAALEGAVRALRANSSTGNSR